MNKLVLCSFICITFITSLVSVASATDLQCYQCNPVTQECDDIKADVVRCGDASMTRCSRQVKKDSTDKTKAIRKCVIPDKGGNVNCPNGYECFNCDKNLCNSNPQPATTAAPDSALATKCAWSTLLAAIFTIIYL